MSDAKVAINFYLSAWLYFGCGTAESLKPQGPTADHAPILTVAPPVAAEIGRRLDEIDALSDKADSHLSFAVQGTEADTLYMQTLKARRDLVAYERATPGIPAAVLFGAQFDLDSGSAEGTLQFDKVDQAVGSRERIANLNDILTHSTGDRPDPRSAYRALKGLGEIYRDQRNPERSAYYFQATLKYRAEILSDPEDGGRILDLAANGLEQISLFAQAVEVRLDLIKYYKNQYQEALAKASATNDPAGLNDGQFHVQMVIGSVLATYRGLEFDLWSQGKFQDVIGALSENQVFLNEAYAAFPGRPDANSLQQKRLERQRLLVMSGETHLSMADYPNAIAALKQALPLVDAQDVQDEPIPYAPKSDQFFIPEQLGVAYDLAGDHVQSEQMYRDALEARLGSRDLAVLVAKVKSREADLAQFMKGYHGQDAIIRAVIPSFFRYNLIQANSEDVRAIAAQLVAQGRFSDAKAVVQVELDTDVAMYGIGPDAAVAHNDLAVIAFRAGRLADTEAEAKQAVDILGAHREFWVGANTDPLKGVNAVGSYADFAQTAFDNYLMSGWKLSASDASLQDRVLGPAFVAAQDTIDSSAAQAMAMAAARTAAGSGPLAALVREQQDLVRQARRFKEQAAGTLDANSGSLSQDVFSEADRVNQRLTEIDAQLDRNFPNYRQLVSPLAMTLEDTRKILAPDEGLLLLIVSHADVYAFGIGSNGAKWNRLENGAGLVGRQIARLRCQVDEGACTAPAAPPSAQTPFEQRGLRRFDLQSAYQLYAELVAPVEDALGGAPRVYVTTSSVLGDLPLGMLTTEAPPAGADDADPAVLRGVKWLADRYAFTYLPAVAGLRLRTVKAAAADVAEPFDGYGDPSLVGDAADALRHTKFFRGLGAEGTVLVDPQMLRRAPPLPGTKLELMAMAGSLGARSDTVHIRDSATEMAVKHDPRLRTASIVAFATHGILPGEVEGVEEPGLILTPPAVATDEDDGILTASEASQLSLSADWVILSACNTASSAGSHGADSLSGLARGFLYAGAHALLASHWAVADDATAALTVEALQERHEHPNITRAQALQLAMRAVRTGKRQDGSAVPNYNPAWAHPFAWAPFTEIANHDD